MADSLNLAGTWELMSQDDPSDLGPTTAPPPADYTPPVAPQPYLLVAGYDLGSPVPVTATLVGDLLDGDRVSGTRTGNRTLTLPIQITAIDRITLAQLTDQLMQAVNVSTFPLRWWPDGGAPLVWDCYRGTCVIQWDQRWEGPDGTPGFQRLVTVTCSAFPFGRSTDRETVSAAAAPITLDAMDDSAPTNATVDGTRSFDGGSSAKVIAEWVVSHWGNYYRSPGPVGRTWAGAQIKDLTQGRAITFWVYVNSAAQQEDFEFTLTLGSASTNSTDSTLLREPKLPTQSWRLLSFPIRHPTSSTGPGVDYSKITSYQLTFRDYRQFWASPPGGGAHQNTLRVNLDLMQINPSSSVALITANGALLTVPGVLGSARAPAALELDNSVDSSGMLLHRPPSDADPAAVILAPVSTGIAGTSIIVPSAGNGYNGTYTVVLAMQSANAPQHEVLVTFKQRITAANTLIATQTLDYTFNPPTDGTPFPYLVVGQVTLPLRAEPADGSSFTSTYEIKVAFNASNPNLAGDAATDIMLLDTRGQTVIATLPLTVRSLYVDEPDPRYGVGLVLASASVGDRSGCYGVMDTVRISGGPFSLAPGDNTVLVHSTGGVPALTASYAPRWMAERSGGTVVQT